MIEVQISNFKVHFKYNSQATLDALLSVSYFTQTNKLKDNFSFELHFILYSKLEFC